MQIKKRAPRSVMQARAHSLALVIDLCYGNHLGSSAQDFDCVPWTTPTLSKIYALADS